MAVTREIRGLLTGTSPLPFLGPKAQARLDELRGKAHEVEPERPVVCEVGKLENRKTVIELWAGERVHRTLAHAWSGWLGCPASCDSRKITLSARASAWEELTVRSLSENEETFLRSGLLAAGEEVAAGLAGELKFADLLPDSLAREVLWKQHYDIASAALVLRELEQRVVRGAPEYAPH